MLEKIPVICSDIQEQLIRGIAYQHACNSTAHNISYIEQLEEVCGVIVLDWYRGNRSRKCACVCVYICVHRGVVGHSGRDTGSRRAEKGECATLINEAINNGNVSTENSTVCSLAHGYIYIYMYILMWVRSISIYTMRISVYARVKYMDSDFARLSTRVF